MEKPEENKEQKLLEGMKQRWLQIGVELEGSWVRGRATVASEIRGAKAVTDHSVKIGHGDPGEIITRPHSTLEALFADVRHLYPDTVHQTCGLHVHVSFTPLDGSIIASKEFYTYFKQKWEDWGKEEKIPRSHEFWYRLSGQNKNARDEFVPENQLKGDGRGAGGKGGNARYTILNFFSWEIHQTVECRLLPMFSDKELAIKAISHLAWIYSSYLNEHGFKSIAFSPASHLRGERALEKYEMKTPDTTPTRYEARAQHPHLERGEGVFYALPGVQMDDMLPFKKDTGKILP